MALKHDLSLKIRPSWVHVNRFIYNIKWYIATAEIAQVVERWRGMQGIAGSNPINPFFGYNSFVFTVVYLFAFFI